MTSCLEITTVSHCKNVCSYCPQQLLLSRYKKKEFMNLSTFMKCIQKVPKEVTIAFAGYAEPFLNPLAANMMEYADLRGHKVNLYTTLVGLTKKDVDIISRVKFNTIQLHLPDAWNQMKANVDDEYIENAKYFLSKIQVNGSHVFGPLHEKLIDLFPNVRRQNLDKDLHTRANNVEQEKIAVKHVERHVGPIECDVVLRRNNGVKTLDFNILLPNGNVTLCCLPKDSKILTSDLIYKNIQDIKIGDRIISHTGNNRKVTKLFERKINEELYSFKTSNYYEPIKTTSNHPILIKSRKTGKIRWLNPKDIQRLDYMVFPKKRPKTKTSIPKDLMWLYGLYLAEGYVNKQGYATIFCLNKNETYIEEKIKQIITKYYPNVNVSTYFYRQSNMDVHVFSKEFADFMHKNFAKYCHKKAISKYIMSAQPDELLELVKGHLDGDGCKQKKRNRHITTSEQLAKQLYVIYLYNNIVPSFSTSHPKDKKRYYEITISNNKNKMIISDEENFYFPIRKIEKIKYSDKVYNFDVEIDESYITNHVVVHNCMDYGLKHVLGNLLTDSYESLFVSDEYKRIQHGLLNDDVDILCRTCKEAKQI